MLWRKPSGQEIETNDLDATIEYCKSLGWEQVGHKKDDGLMESAESFADNPATSGVIEDTDQPLPTGVIYISDSNEYQVEYDGLLYNLPTREEAIEYAQKELERKASLIPQDE